MTSRDEERRRLTDEADAAMVGLITDHLEGSFAPESKPNTLTGIGVL